MPATDSPGSTLRLMRGRVAKPASVGGYSRTGILQRAAELSSPANEAGFGSTVVRPKAALRGAGGAASAGGATAEGRSTAASE